MLGCHNPCTGLNLSRAEHLEMFTGTERRGRSSTESSLLGNLPGQQPRMCEHTKSEIPAQICPWKNPHHPLQLLIQQGKWQQEPKNVGTIPAGAGHQPCTLGTPWHSPGRIPNPWSPLENTPGSAFRSSGLGTSEIQFGGDGALSSWRSLWPDVSGIFLWGFSFL